MFVRTESERTTGLAAASADVTRLRLALDCCSARSLDADRRGKVLIRSDSGGSNDDAEQHAGSDSDRQRAHPPRRAAARRPGALSTPRRSGWRCSMPGPAVRCRSTARRGGSSGSCAVRTPRWSSCWRSSPTRRGDGREIRLGELSLADELRNAETVRAEEIEISVPDGRSVTVLVNATPIRSADGAVVSLVVTMQDLAPLEELERLRAEFLGMVGHELRTPLTSIKGSATTALDTEPELDPAEMREFFRIIRRAGRSHARADRRPAGCRAHRLGHALGIPRAGGGRGLSNGFQY